MPNLLNRASLSPANDDGICANILEQMKRVELRQREAKDATKIMSMCTPDECERVFPGSSLEDIQHAATTEVIELRRLLSNAGIDPDVIGRSLS